VHRWITSIPLPKRGETTSISQTGRIETAQVVLDSIQYLGGESNLCSLTYRIHNTPGRVQIVRVRDQRGTNLVYTHRKLDRLDKKMDFMAQPESRSVEIMFAHAHPVTVEFSSPVTILRTNVAHWPTPEPSPIGATN
jgi:hypothetical protein